VKQQAWIFDIDGTLANTDHRIHHIKPKEGEKKNWGKFFHAAKDDKPYEHVLWLNQAIHRDSGNLDTLIVVTARPDNLRKETEQWLSDKEVIWDLLYMRPASERKPDFEVKRDIYREFIKPHFDVVAAFEDRLHVAKMWREEGVPVLLCGDDWLNGDWSK
jgi:FMN phosphatase YigB (HAD superfamily)